MPDEQALIERAQRGDMDAFHELVEHSKINVYRLAYDLTGNRHDAEDLSQEVYIKAFRSLAQFRGSSKWSTWLYRITVNTANDSRRPKMRSATEYRDDMGTTDTGLQYEDRGSISPVRAAASGVTQRHIEEALATLSPQERAVFVLRHYHDLPIRQVAETMAIAEGTVKAYLFRAVQRLRKELAVYGKELGWEG